MVWLNQTPEEVLRQWLRDTPVPMLASKKAGSILWANAAFEELIKYSTWELTCGMNGQGISWMELSVPDGNLEADKKMVEELVAGERTSFSVIKQYRPKNSKPVWVEINVQRYPKQLPQNVLPEFFLVTVIELPEDSQLAADISAETLKLVDLRLQALEQKLDNALKSPTELEVILTSLAKIIEKYPKISGFVFLVMLVMLLGNGLIQAIENTKKILSLETPAASSQK